MTSKTLFHSNEIGLKHRAFTNSTDLPTSPSRKILNPASEIFSHLPKVTQPGSVISSSIPCSSDCPTVDIHIQLFLGGGYHCCFLNSQWLLCATRMENHYIGGWNWKENLLMSCRLDRILPLPPLPTYICKSHFTWVFLLSSLHKEQCYWLAWHFRLHEFSKLRSKGNKDLVTFIFSLISLENRKLL